MSSQQSESLSITSEVVANYNHCHAMTMEYFEVLQHFRVDQELAQVRECLFVPLVMKPFDMHKALRWRDLLEPRLRRPEWARGFGAIERILLGYADTGYPLGCYADEPIREMSGELRLQLSIARPRELRDGEDVATYLATTWDFWETLFGPGSAQKAYDSSVEDRELADRIFAAEQAPRVARAFAESLTFTLVVVDPVTGATREEALTADVTMVSDYRAGGLHLVSFRATATPPGVTRAMIRAIRVAASVPGLSPSSATLLRMADVTYATDYAQHALVANRWMRDDILDGDHAQISTVSLSRDEERDPREEDRESLAGLLKHLNEFVEHYHQVIWWRMDPNRRFMLLDGFTAPNSGGRSLASVVENRLISIVGNALVMPVAPGYQLDPLVRRRTEEGGPVDLVELYRPPLPFPPKRIALPTRGVHAEAILGECDSCEIRDDTRFWDWSSEPIPGNEPTPIAEISTATRRQEPADATPTPLPAPIVAIQNAPAAPEPLSISALADVLGKQGLFKDVTGLEGNQANALAAFEQSLKTANAFGKLAASGAKATLANRSGERVMRKVQEAEASGLLSRDDAKQVVSRLFGVMNGEAADTDMPLSQDPAVKKALGAVNAAPGRKSIKVASGTGSTAQTVETETGVAAPGGAAAVMDFRIGGVVPLRQAEPALLLGRGADHAGLPSAPAVPGRGDGPPRRRAGLRGPLRGGHRPAARPGGEVPHRLRARRRELRRADGGRDRGRAQGAWAALGDRGRGRLARLLDPCPRRDRHHGRRHAVGHAAHRERPGGREGGAEEPRRLRREGRPTLSGGHRDLRGASRRPFSRFEGIGPSSLGLDAELVHRLDQRGAAASVVKIWGWRSFWLSNRPRTAVVAAIEKAVGEITTTHTPSAVERPPRARSWPRAGRRGAGRGATRRPCGGRRG